MKEDGIGLGKPTTLAKEGIGYVKNEGCDFWIWRLGWLIWKDVMSENTNVILQVSSSWCNPCQQAKRYVNSIGAEDKIIYVDVEENEALVAEYKIKNLPTFIHLDIDGKEVSRFVGFDKNKIDGMLESL